MAVQREDGREAGQLRAMGCELRPLTRCDGSARFNLNTTSAMAGVFGPREAKSNVKQSDESVVLVSFNAADGPPSAEEKEVQGILRQALEAIVVRSQNPMTQIDVSVQCNHNDGGLLAASVNASLAALSDAGVALRSQAAAVCVAVGKDGTLLLDPTESECEGAEAVVTFVVCGEDGSVVSSHCSGSCSEESYFNALEAASAGARSIVSFLRIVFEKRVTDERRCWSVAD
mmetsp:Transcript_26032/g.65712  ORF Transcript_26032/g.65712 Transcript_26032/m.65712 type:complete len:230 (-) Transcript_26032:31-720(-)